MNDLQPIIDAAKLEAERLADKFEAAERASREAWAEWREHLMYLRRLQRKARLSKAETPPRSTPPSETESTR